jgi:hypothetical protein
MLSLGTLLASSTVGVLAVVSSSAGDDGECASERELEEFVSTCGSNGRVGRSGTDRIELAQFSS